MRAFVVVGVVAMGACLSIDTTDLATSVAPGRDAGLPAPPASTSVPGACADPNAACFVVPEGWDGPIALVDDRVSCPASLPNVNLTRGAGLSAPLATCRCLCENPTGGSCAGRLVMQGMATCFATCSAIRTLPIGDCQSASTCDGATGRFASVSTEIDAAPTCAVSRVDIDRPPFKFERTVRTCEAVKPPAQEACAAGRRCAPSNVVQGLCIAQAGDLTCPAEYPNRVLTHRTGDDQRRCTGCTCAPTNVACAGRFFVGTSKTNCETNVGTESPPNGCIDLGIGGQVKFIGPTTPTAACGVSGFPVLEGAVVGVDPITICCER
jgi:hypothetical protein